MSDDYTAEAILGKKVELGKTKFLVKWRGYPASEATWCAHATLCCTDRRPSPMVTAQLTRLAPPGSAKTPAGWKMIKTPAG